MTITAKIIADSCSPSGIRLTTLELKYPRFIHSELMTHRMFSRNASSSRAIPLKLTLEQVRDNPARPVHWGKSQKGMQADHEVENPDLAEDHWISASKMAVRYAESLHCQGLHKQVANRLLEPFLHIKVLVTATEWSNFFELRNHPDAQPEIQQLAQYMQRAMEASTPVDLEPGQWHMPYVLKHDPTEYDASYARKASAGRCARVSYANHDGSPAVDSADYRLAQRLLRAKHMSPFEHQATPLPYHRWLGDARWEKGITHVDRDRNLWSANFRGWIQHRQLLEHSDD